MLTINARCAVPLLAVLFFASLASVVAAASPKPWYEGDERCPPPRDDGTYSAPYKAADHPNDYPTFADADKPGWSCSYQREDGVIVQFGDSRTPQQQWLGLWSSNTHEDD